MRPSRAAGGDSARLPGSRLLVAYMTDADLEPDGERNCSETIGDCSMTPRILARAWTAAAPTSSYRCWRRTVRGSIARLAVTGWQSETRPWRRIRCLAHGICRALESGIDAAEVIASDRVHRDHVAREVRAPVGAGVRCVLTKASRVLWP